MLTVVVVTSLVALTQTGAAAGADDAPPVFFADHALVDGRTLYSWPALGRGVTYRIGNPFEDLAAYKNVGGRTTYHAPTTDASSAAIVVAAMEGPRILAKLVVSLSRGAKSAPDAEYQISSNDGLLIRWGGATEHSRVYRDGFLGRTDRPGEYRDETYADGGTDVTVQTPSTASAPAGTMGFAIAPNILGLSGKPASKGRTSLPEVDFPAAGSITALAEFPSGARLRTRFRYTTFIAEDFVDGPLAGCNGYAFFGGDNRNFGFEGSHRTNVDFTAFWYDGSGNVVSNSALAVSVGTTKAYNSAKQLVATATAAPNAYYTGGLGILNGPIVSADNSFMTAEIKHSIANPLCDSYTPAIDWEVSVTLYRNGSYFISGVHDAAPAHQIHIEQVYHPGTFLQRLVYSKNRLSFNYLFPPAPSEVINVSGSGPNYQVAT